MDLLGFFYSGSSDSGSSSAESPSSESSDSSDSEATEVDITGNTSDSSYEPVQRRRQRLGIPRPDTPPPRQRRRFGNRRAGTPPPRQRRRIIAPEDDTPPLQDPVIDDTGYVDVETVEDQLDREEVIDVETVEERQVQEEARPSGSATTSARKPETDDDDDEQNCPICLEPWANAGPHRLCCLKCGHLFGRSCLERWLSGCPRGQTRCPQCNRSAKKSDVRTLFAKKLKALDMTDRLRLEEDLKTEQESRRRAELQVTQLGIQLAMQRAQIESLQTRIKEAAASVTDQLATQNPVVLTQGSEKLYKLSKQIEISNNGGCRVLAYSSELGLLVASQNNPAQIFAAYGVRKMDAVAFRTSHYIPLHKKAIRDLAFHPVKSDLLLSVSLDCTARLTNVRSHGSVASFPSRVGALWSCCWDWGNTNIFYAGTQRGEVGQFDMRRLDGPLKWFPRTGDVSPVTSLVSVRPSAGSSMPRGGIIAGHLAGVWAHEWEGESEISSTKFPLQGPFMSVAFDPASRFLLASSRASSQHLRETHSVCELEYDNNQKCRVVQTFEGGHLQKHLSRSCLIPQLPPSGDVLIAAYQETASSIKLWSVTESSFKLGLPTSEHILDVLPLPYNGKNTLAALSEKKLYIYSQP